MNEIGMTIILDELGLTRFVDGKNLCPYKCEQRAKLLGLRAKQLEHIGKDADAESGRDSPGSHVDELG